MGTFYNIEMSSYIFDEIIFALEECAKYSRDYVEIEEKVHTIDYLEEEKYRDSQKQNEEMRRWSEHQQLFTENKKPDNTFLYSAIYECLNNTELKELSVEPLYHLIMELIDIFDKYKEKELSDMIR